MATVEVGVQARVGFASKTGPRKENEDFAAALYGAELPEPRQEVVGGDRRRNRRRQGRPRRGRNRGARLSRRVLRSARDHGGAARRRQDRQRAQRLDQYPGPSGPRSGGNGLHVHRAGAARPHRASAACRRHACLSVQRRSPDLPDRRPRAAGWRGPLAHADPRAWASRRRCASTTRRNRWRCTTASCCAATACTGF